VAGVPDGLILDRRRLRGLHQFDFVAFRGIDEGKTAAPGGHMRAIRKLEAQLSQTSSEMFQAFHLEGQVGQVGLDLDRPARWVMTQSMSSSLSGAFKKTSS
jgi:hypothetical protein